MIRASKLVDGIDLGLKKKYNLAEVFVDLKESDANDLGDADSFENYFQLMTSSTQPLVDPSLAVRQVKAKVDEGDILDKLCTPCVGSKST